MQCLHTGDQVGLVRVLITTMADPASGGAKQHHGRNPRLGQRRAVVQRPRDDRIAAAAHRCSQPDQPGIERDRNLAFGIGRLAGSDAFLLNTGRVDPSVPRSKRLLSDERSNVFVYMTGHGGNEFLKFQDNEEISAFDVADAFEQMWQKKR